MNIRKMISIFVLSLLALSMIPAIAAGMDNEDTAMVFLVDEFEADKKPPDVGKPPEDDPEPDPEPSQVTPWGITQIKAHLASNTGADITVAVVDTGIDADHPDLKSNILGGVNFVPTGRKVDPNRWNDDNGHGTHVAGTIAAVDNSIGVIGVAPNVGLYAVKVLDRKGSGYLDWVISGIEWAITQDVDIITMSLSTDSDVQELEDVCIKAENAGIVVVAASGNDGSSVDYPAAYDSVIAVGATDNTDTRVYWSNYGPELELVGPGVSILSTWNDGGYNTISGTSMATPHVTGTVALTLNSQPGIYDLDGDGWDPSEVRSKLAGTATDLNTAGWDQYYGYGLVDAQAASA